MTISFCDGSNPTHFSLIFIRTLRCGNAEIVGPTGIGNQGSVISATTPVKTPS
jgi:hypothetical protein